MSGKNIWKFGNFWELKSEKGYVLREGETELPPDLKKLWADAMKIRKVSEDNIKVVLSVVKHGKSSSGNLMMQGLL